jgi:methionine aminotransferase
MSQLAAKYNAINLGQGFPDFDMPEALVEEVYKAMRDGRNQYVHTNGLPLLREILAGKVAQLYGTSIQPMQQITITPGGTYAIYTALTSFLTPGDEVIVFEPAYDSYIPNIELNGAKAVRISLEFPEYAIPWHRVEQSITSRTKAIIINSPHNPTGAVLTERDIEHLSILAEKHNLIIISDEVYEHIIFDDKFHHSILRYPNLMERSFVCFSFGKTYHCTGWKVGYCIGAPNLMQEFTKVHQFNAFSVNSATQYGLAAFMSYDTSYQKLSSQLQTKRDYLQELLSGTLFHPLPSSGSYFQCYRFGDYTQDADLDFAETLTKKAGVATIPMSAFYLDGNDYKVLRFCFAKKDATLEQAAERIRRFVSM